MASDDFNFDADLPEPLDSGTKIKVLIDCQDGTLELVGRLQHVYDGTQDAIFLKHGRKTRIVPAYRVLYVEEETTARDIGVDEA